MNGIDITQVLKEKLQADIGKQVEDEIVSSLIADIEVRIREIVKRHTDQMIIGDVKQLRDVVDMSDRLRVEVSFSDQNSSGEG